MCDADINPGIVETGALSRRALVAAGFAVAGLAAAAHAETPVVEKDVTVKTADGMADAALFYPAGKGRWPAVLVWPDIMGLRPVFREMGKRLAAAGYTVLVPNPFYRSAKAPVVGDNFDFSNAEARGKLMAMRGAMSDAGIESDARAYLAFLDAQPQTARAKKAGVQGYCMGGPLAFHTAAAVPNRIGAVATFHGGGLVTDKPDSPHLLIAKTHAAYLICVAKNDDARGPNDKEVLRQTLASTHHVATVDVYQGDHGWTVPGSAVYNQAEAERAWGELMKLYKARLV